MSSLALSNLDLLLVSLALWLVWKIAIPYVHRKRVNTPLRGPRNPSFLFGFSRHILESDNPADYHESWAEQYGPAFVISRGIGLSHTVLCDPKAATHVLSKETWGYVQTDSDRKRRQAFLGHGLLSSEGEDHRRQRKALTPGFSNASIRKLTDIFYDSVYKTKSKWEGILEGSSDNIIEVQQWMNHISLDSMGIAAFSSPVGTLDGNYSPIGDIFDSFSVLPNTLSSKIANALLQAFPWAVYLPTKANTQRYKLADVATKIAEDLIARDQKGDLGGNDDSDKSVLGLLLKSERAISPGLRTSRSEIIAQINVLWLAGYETSSVTMTWALIELSRNPEVQAKLRAELAQYSGKDLTWDQLGQLPYLEGVVQETLRLHPAVPELIKMAAEDDIIPFSTPIRLPNGTETNSLSVAKGTIVNIPVGCVNRYPPFWGSDAKEFKPERWIDFEERKDYDGLKAREIRGHRHVLTFSSGQRICLGMAFALAEIKAVLSVLVREFSFELPNGPNTEITIHQSLLKRPKVAGTKGAHVPLRVRKLE